VLDAEGVERGASVARQAFVRQRSIDVAGVAVTLQLNGHHVEAVREHGQQLGKQLSMVPTAPWSSTRGAPLPWCS
jgi:hypothetical protein